MRPVFHFRPWRIQAHVTIRLALETTHGLAEGAAAAGYAAARRLCAELASKRVVIVHSGQDLDRNTLRWALGMFDA